ncbi:MAG TPA: uroporphyrinogen-III C-methyltransferase [Lentisphaeria bacterium]|nr:MAG: uroporphyrinogen-III C-methyltransferase [Lentisphaerae bacterium GWF2_50_93]HCE42499.1 uroporphyrinogen-III C-methyltransferase [Lentisphaeria bacterium]
MKRIKIKAGTRGSKLSVAQTSDSLERLREKLPFIEFRLETISTPGDRDRKTDLRISPADFFTKDLDDAISSGKIDCAISSAKDLPDPMPEGIDWFWLPWSEDARDVIILPEAQRGKGTKAQSFILNQKSSIKNHQSKIRIGVSSARREEYCRRKFPKAELLPIRGNIDDRIAQLDAGKFDMLIMAAAGLKRLGLEDRISEYICEAELPPPEGQGWLALTYRKGDRIFNEIRKLFVKSVVFAGAGPGDADLATAGAVDALGKCEVCLYDALSTPELLKHLPPSAMAVYVGKRMSAHSSSQQEINRLIAKFARQGKRLVRLKGGDPTIFGRLAEEVETLDDLELPYRVIPGVSSMNAVGATGLMLTRRGLSRGFSVMTPRKSGSSEFQHVSREERLRFPSVFFMGLSETANIAKCLIKDGRNKNEPASIVLSAGNESEQKVVSGSLSEFARSVIKIPKGEAPGIFIIGENADAKFLLKKNGALQGKRILLTCSDAIMDKAVNKVREFGGIPIRMPFIKLVPCIDREGFGLRLFSCKWVVITSPSSARIFLNAIKEFIPDFRHLYKARIIVCGPGTSEEFSNTSILPDYVAEEDFGAKGIIKTAKSIIKKGDYILRVCSDKADKRLTHELCMMGAAVTEEVIYRNVPVKHEKLPDFDAVLFASSSAVESFRDNFGLEKLKGNYTVVIGKPTLDTLKKLKCRSNIVLAKEATINGCIDSLAETIVERELCLRRN